MVGPTELLGRALGRPSPVECPERKRPLSSPVACSAPGCAPGPRPGVLFALADREPIQPLGWHREVGVGVSGLGGLAERQAQWPAGFQKLPQAPVGAGRWLSSPR